MILETLRRARKLKYTVAIVSVRKGQTPGVDDKLDLGWSYFDSQCLNTKLTYYWDGKERQDKIYSMLSTLWATNRYETDAVARLDSWKDLGCNSWSMKWNRKWVTDFFPLFFGLSQRKEDSREWTQQHVLPIKSPVHRGGCLTTHEPCNRGTEHLLQDVSAAHTCSQTKCTQTQWVESETQS